MVAREQIISEFSSIMYPTKGICGLVTEQYGTTYLFDVLLNIEKNPLTKVQLVQLFNMQHIGSFSDGFFKYYWLEKPTHHFYKIDDFPIKNDNTLHCIHSLKQFKWGLQRLFIDCIYVFGNIETGFRNLSNKTYQEIKSFYEELCIDTYSIEQRGNTLKFEMIDRNDRYLISEMACKTLGDGSANVEELTEKLIKEYKHAINKGIHNPKFKDLLSGKYSEVEEDNQMSLFVCTDYLENIISSEEDVRKNAADLAKRYSIARDSAIKNTKLFLSLANELDVYVATSMRNKDDFVNMADFCNTIFKSDQLCDFNLRYFDPTISATASHEDKGLIECLMVKAAKILIYNSGDKESYGKDAEAAMALCLGKPVIFYCGTDGPQSNFFKNVHPLSRLVNFNNGVASGAIICNTTEEVILIINNILNNNMEYILQQKEGSPGYYLLIEKLTKSVIRVQTNDEYLTTTFWNYYN